MALHQRVVDLVDGAVAEGVLEHASRRARTCRSPSRPRCRRRAAARSPAARRRRWWRSGSRPRRGDRPRSGRSSRATGARRRRPACRSPRSTSSSWMIWMPSTISGTTSSGSAIDRDRHVEHRAGVHPVALGRRRRRRRCTWPSAIRSAARVRERPNIRAIAASTRSPARPSGTGSVRWSALRSRAGRVRLVAARGRGCRRAGCRGRPGRRISAGGDVDAHVGDVEDRPVRQHRGSRRRGRAATPGVAEDPVGEVAADAGRAAGRARPPSSGLPTRRPSQSTTTHRGDRDAGEQRRCTPCRC